MVRLLWFLLCLSLVCPVWAVKPRIPLSLAWEVSAMAEDEARLSLRLTAMQSGRVAVRVLLPAGVRLLEGKTDWLGEVDAGEQRPLTLTVSGSGEIRALATLLEGPGVMRTEAVIRVGTVWPGGVIRKGEDPLSSHWTHHGGRGVWEFRTSPR